MRIRGLGGAVGLLCTVLLLCTFSAVAAAMPNLRVRGTTLIDGPGYGHVVTLRGVNRSGLEYACIDGWGFFDSPHPNRIDSAGMIAAMNSWDINVVRVPLNEDCWLNVNTPKGRGGAPYRKIVQAYVKALNKAHLYVILDLQVAAPGKIKARHLERMPDMDHALAFWRSVATTFKNNHALIFDLYNEPNHIDWGCWQNGCKISAYDDGYGPQPSYKAAGMQQLVDAVRGTGATQPLMLGGIGYAHSLTSWLAHEPRDKFHQLVAAEHNYGVLSPCETDCMNAILAAHNKVPVVLGELGEIDCEQTYVDQLMPWADSHGISYLGWAWDAVEPGSWTCGNGPSLIQNYNGTPTDFGVGMRDHFRALGVPPQPS